MKWLESLLKADKGTISSKRFAGVIGWLVVIIVVLYCSFNKVEAPRCFTEFMAFSAGLLGWDSFTGIWKNRENKKE